MFELTNERSAPSNSKGSKSAPMELTFSIQNFYSNENLFVTLWLLIQALILDLTDALISII
jgi:hypothetical protein